MLSFTPLTPAGSWMRKVAGPLALGAACLLSLLTACGGNSSSSAPADTAPGISSQPASVTVVAPAPASFSVGATGTAPSFQWKKNGTAIANATGAAYTTPPTSSADDSATYSVKVSNSLGSVDSSSATLHVNFVTITGQPSSQATPTGGNATFTVAATGAAGGTLTYQWKKAGTPIAGATMATLAVTNASASDMASYTCDVVGHLNGTTTTAVTSTAASLALVDPPVIAGQPASLTVPEGNPASFTVTATAPAGGTLSYQWKLRNAPIAGATSATFAIPAATLADQGSYSCIVTNTQNGATEIRSTSPVLLSVVGLPMFITQPSGATLFPGDALTLSAEATGNSVVSYQWQKNGTALPGATAPSYAIASATSADDGIYTCLAMNTQFGVTATATSSPATVTVQLFPAITSEPGSRTVMAGQTATFSLTAKGQNLTYAWYKNGTVIPASNAPSYTTPATTIADDQAQFWCVVSNGNLPNATSAHATLTVTPAATLFKASAQTLSMGEGVILTYAYDAAATATLKIGGGTPTAVTNGGSTVDYPVINTTYTLAVTTAGVTSTFPLAVTVKTYAPKHAYVVNFGSNDVFHYPVDATSSAPVKAAIGAPVATGAGPVHVTASPDEKYLYVANNTAASISAYSVDAATGALTSLGADTALSAYASPWCSAVDPTGKWLYVACDNGIEVFSLSAGVATSAPTLSTAIPGRVQGDLLMHPSGTFLFVLDNGHNKVKAFAINPTTGALSYSSEISLTTTNPSGLAFDRASNLIFTRGTDTRTGPDGTGVQYTFNAGIDVLGMDFQTGVLSHKSTYAGYAINTYYSAAVGYDYYLPFVPGKNTLGRHGLSFSRKPGIDQLFHGFTTEIYGLTLSQWDVDTTAGALLGDTVNPTMQTGSSPYFFGSGMVMSGGGDSFIGDRSGSVFIYPLPDVNQMFTYTSNAQGWITPMSNFSGEIPRSTGSSPSHGCFTGTLQ